MRIKEFVDYLLGSYPSVLHPSDQGVKDLMKTVRSLRLTTGQMQSVYDEVVKISQYFPKPFDVIEACQRLNFSTSGQRPKFEVAWETFEHDGRRYARKVGSIQPESAEDQWRRWKSEACDEQEGKEAFKEAYREAGGLSDSDFRRVGESIQRDAECVGSDSSISISGLGVEVEYVDDSMCANPEEPIEQPEMWWDRL